MLREVIMKKITFIIVAVFFLFFIFACSTNEELEQGTNSQTGENLPIVENEYTTSIDCGDIAKFQIKNGVLYGSGWNNAGQFGIGVVDDENYENVIVAEGVIHIDYNGCSLIYLTEDGNLYGLGANPAGMLGKKRVIEPGINIFSNDDYVVTPCHIMEDVKFASLGTQHLLIQKTDNTLWCLGSNRNGQIGIGEELTYSYEPVYIMDEVLLIDAMYYNSAVITSDYNLYIWGDNSQGQVGNGKSGNGFPTISDCISYKPELVMEDVCSFFFYENENYKLRWEAKKINSN